MSELFQSFQNLKLKYRELFLDTARQISEQVELLRPDSFKGEIFDSYEPKSLGYIWQDSVLYMLQSDYKDNFKNYLLRMKSLRDGCSCIMCGTCCRLAVSEFSPDELKMKASQGDNFATQFMDTFIPYNSVEDASVVFGEYVEMLANTEKSGFYFYHCPKVTEDNKCPDYENRPQICRDFPDNPLAFLAPLCGYKDWKLKSEHISLKLNAEAEIITFYENKIKDSRK